MSAIELPLTIEVVPSSCWYSNVRSNVTAHTWDRLQKETFSSANHKCEICHSPAALDCHEIWEYDDHLCIQRLIRLVALCPSCHLVKHIGLAIKEGKIEEALKWFCLVNQTTSSEAVAYVQRAMQIHAIRSQYQWQLNLDYLSTKKGVLLDNQGMEIGLRWKV